MTYISFYYYIFVIVLLALYYLLPLKIRWVSLLIGSLGFYWEITQHSIKSLVILTVSALICWICSRLIEEDKGNRKLWLGIALFFTAIPLFAVTEGEFIISMIVRKSLPGWWIVPVGISFYSLQLIAYSVDVYKKKIHADNNFLHFLLFVSFFPQIIQGPIPRYDQLAGQLTEGHNFDEEGFVKGFMLILWGFFLKLCIADKAAVVVNTVFDNYPGYPGIYVLIAGILYSFQLYADFLACTSLAQGVSALFGISLVNNFNHPYFSKSVKEFWGRWHISLSTWLRDYIYIPLGGNRKGRIRKYINILITFGISGLWHGGNYKFLFWGLLHGVYQIIDDLTAPVKNRLTQNRFKKGIDVLNTLITFFFVMLAWIIFRADKLKTGLSMIKSIFTVHNPWVLTNNALFDMGLVEKEWYVLLFCLFVLLFVSWKQEKGAEIRNRILQYNIVLRWCIYIGAILFILIFGTYGYGYDPAAFIYGGF